MTILYTSPELTISVDADEIAPLVRDICCQIIGIEVFFDIIHFEVYHDWQSVSFFDVARQEEVSILGPGGAWKCYEKLSQHVQELHWSFRSPPPTVLSAEA